MAIDIIGDNIFSGYLNWDFGLMGIVAVIFLVFIGGGMFMGMRYPRRSFLVSRDGTRIFNNRTFRLDGDEIVSDNIFEILFQQTTVGEDFKEFQSCIINSKQTYLGAMVKKHLVPLTFSTDVPQPVDVQKEDGTTERQIQFVPAIIPNEITVGHKIAERNIELQRKKKLISDANKSLLMNIMTVAPIALILIATIIGGYIGSKAITDAQSQIVAPLKSAIDSLNALNTNLAISLNQSIPKRYVAPDAGGG